MCLLVALIPQGVTDSSNLKWNDLLIIVFATIGKAMTSAAFNSVYIYTSFMFPVKVRNTLLLFVSSVGRIGSIISPEINLLGDIIWKPLSYIIFSASAFIGCLFVASLPDPSKNYL